MNTIICNKCGNVIEVSQALEDAARRSIETQMKEANRKEIDRLRKEAEEQTTAKVKEHFDVLLKSQQQENEENAKHNRQLQDQLTALMKQLREEKRVRGNMEVEMQKKLLAEQDKIREDVQKKAEEEHALKDKEKDKKLLDVLKMNEELKRKLEQGSQQTQGEVLELETEELLHREFPGDQIKEVVKGQRGADIIQEVIDKYGNKCGIILWETKNGNWNNGWLEKLREDQRRVNAQIAVLVAAHLPEYVKNFQFHEGVWITNRESVIGLAWAIRINIAQLYNARLAGVGKNEKMEIIYRYLTGVEFKHRVEAIVESFTNLQVDLEREKRWFQTKWARQETEIRRIVDHTHGMYGDLQAITGRLLPAVKGLDDPMKNQENTSDTQKLL